MTTPARLALLLFALLAFACQTPLGPSGDEAPTELSTPEAPAPVDGHAKLPRDVTPTLYELELTIDPAAPRFSGSVHIHTRFDAPRSRVILSSQELEIERAFALVDGLGLGAEPLYGENGGLLLRFPSELPAGEHVITLDFSGPLSEVPRGLYRVKEGEDWYAFTQFEPLDARRAFPCFDEPRFKTPFRVMLRTPEGLVAATNGPSTGDTTTDGLTTTTFAETRPLPTYLVAFAVGPFDVVEGPDGATSIPFRILTPRGKGGMTDYAIERTPVILAALEDYFGSPYPFAKLDYVAVPNFSAGAMENVGLVTYRERLLLLPEDAPASIRSAHQNVVAHELAHMWFGNLVTPAWWDELWLNESFATWMASKIVAQVDPDLEAELSAVSRATRVMSYDAQKDTRAIRQPIRHGGDVFNAFDPITYGKGAAILRMVETWSGEAAFRDGVRAYMQAHQWGNARNRDLQAALEASTRLPIGDTMHRFLDQPGVPLVSLDWTCEDRALTLELSQQRYLPAGSDASQGKPWRIPVCLRLGGPEPRTQCLLLEQPEQTLTWYGGACPTWIHPNADERGYYHWELPRDHTLALVTTHRAQLSMPEKIGLHPHILALLEAGRLAADDYLSVLETLADEEHRMLVSNVIRGLGLIEEISIREHNREAFQAFVRRLLTPHLERLGLEPRDGEPLEQRRLRPSVIRTLAIHGADPALRQRAIALTERFLDDPDSLSSEDVQLYLPLAARWAPPELWPRLRDAFDAHASNPARRSALLSALANVQTRPELERSLGLLLDGTLRAQDAWSILGPSLGEAHTRDITWAWLQSHDAELRELLGPQSARSLPWLASSFCDAERRDEAEAFFSDPERSPPGTARNLALVLESIDRCIQLRDATQEAVDRFLE